MATIDLRGDGGGYIPENATLRTAVLRKTVDFSDNNAESGDIMQVMDLKGPVEIKSAQVQVRTAEGGAATIDLGLSTDGSTDNSLIDGGDANTEGWLQGDGVNGDNDGSTYAGMYPIFKSADQQVVLTAQAAMDAAVVDVLVEVAYKGIVR